MFEKTKDVKLSISGMSCNHCANTVTQALKSVKGVKKVSVSLEDKTAHITAKETVAASALIDAVSSAGFSAKEM